MLILTIETVGAERFVRGFNRYVEDIQDFTEVFELLYLDFLEIEETQFATGGSRSSGESWAALSPNYARWKAKHAPGRPVLTLSGAMRAALTSRTGASGQIKDIRGKEKRATFGVSMQRAYWHQHGTRKMPARPVVQLTEADKRRWARTVQTWAKRKLEADLGQGALLG